MPRRTPCSTLFPYTTLFRSTCVHRRIAAILAIAIVSAFGVRAYLNTPIEAFPDVTNAQVTVITQNPGYAPEEIEDRKSTRLNSSHVSISYAVFCLKKKIQK